MSTLNESILSAAEALPEGGLLSPKEFLHLASRGAVDQTFSRLAREGHRLHVGRGAYTRPVDGRFGVYPPSTESIIETIKSTSGEQVVSRDATEANVLGLTTQLPAREVFLTSGPARKQQLGKRQMELIQGPKWAALALGAQLPLFGQRSPPITKLLCVLDFLLHE